MVEVTGGEGGVGAALSTTAGGEQLKRRPAIVGIDSGGTFTDTLVLYPGGTLRSFKVPSTPTQPADAILECLELAKLLPGGAFHPGDADEMDPPASGERPPSRMDVAVGTTIATNTVLERKGARVAFVTTRGFRDMLDIGRQRRPGLYDPTITKPPPLVPPDLVFEVEERVNARGEIIIEPGNDQCIQLARDIRGSGAEAVALCTLFSFLNPANERAISVHLSTFPMSVSSDLLPQMREYERASTTVLDAYVKPIIWHFVGELVARVSTLPDEMLGFDDMGGDECGGDVDMSLARSDHGTEGMFTSPVAINLMRSNGGVTPLDDAVNRPGELLLSGPAGGVLGAVFLARLTGEGNLLCLDMGGTSADISVIIDGEAQWTGSGMVGHHPLALPMVEVVTIGAGGGSIARDDQGILSVGPESAGAKPGPMCYAMGGTEPTVTDANVCAGRIGASTVLGERVPVQYEKAMEGMEALASQLGMSADESIEAVLDVVNTRMAHAARGVLSSKGLDPADFTLVTFGGSGPLHACALADELEMDRVIVPMHPGVFSSLGILIAGMKYHFTSTLLAPLDASCCTSIDAAVEKLFGMYREKLAALEVPPSRGTIRFMAALRYLGQSFEINIPIKALDGHWDLSHRDPSSLTGAPMSEEVIPALVEAFNAEHERLYGHRLSDAAVEMVALHMMCESSRPGAETALQTLGFSLGNGQHKEGTGWPISKERRKCLVGGEWEEVNVWSRVSMGQGWRATGPMVVEEPLCTLFVDRGWSAVVDEHGCIVMERLKGEKDDANSQGSGEGIDIDYRQALMREEPR